KSGSWSGPGRTMTSNPQLAYPSATRFSSFSKSMTSLWKWERVYGIFNSHVHELIPGLHRGYDDLRRPHEGEGRVNAHVGDFCLPDLAVVLIDDTLHHIEDRLRHVIDIQ